MWILFDLVPIRLTDTARPVVRNELARLARDFEATVQAMDIRRHVADAWDRLHAPLQLASEPDAWLRLQPAAVHFSGINITNQVLHASASITATTEVVLGDRPLPFPPSSLPSIEEGEERAGFLVQLPLLLQYNALESALGDILRIEQRWAPLPGRPRDYLTVHDVEVYPSGEALTVGVHFTADVAGSALDASGSVYLQGIPALDLTQDTVSVDELQLTAATDNSLVDRAVALFDEELRGALAQALTYSFVDDYERLLLAANSGLNIDLAPNVRSQGALKYLDVSDVVLGERGIQLSVVSAGTLQLEVEP